MENFKVGDRIDIYEILNDGDYPEGMFTAGTWRMGKPNDAFLNLESLRSNKVVINPEWLSMYVRGDGVYLNARKVGTMVVKRLK